MSSYHSLSWLRKSRSRASCSDSCSGVRNTTIPSTTGYAVAQVGHTNASPTGASGAPWSLGQQSRFRSAASRSTGKTLTEAREDLFEQLGGRLVRGPGPVRAAGQAVAGLVLVEADGPRPVGLGDVPV